MCAKAQDQLAKANQLFFVISPSFNFKNKPPIFLINILKKIIKEL